MHDLEYSREDKRFYLKLNEYLKSYERAYKLSIEDEKRLLYYIIIFIYFYREITSDEVMKRIIRYRIDEKTLMRDTLEFVKFKIDHVEEEL